MKDPIRARVERLLVSRYGNVDEELFAAGILDSLRAIEFALDLEAEFQVPMSSVTLLDMQTMTRLVDRVEECLADGNTNRDGGNVTRSINGKSELLREMITGRGIIELPGCYDVLSAMLLEEAGFETVFLSGYGVAASQLGNPDIGLTSLTETALASKNVAAAVDLPIIVDADNGYGNEDNVIRTIFELEYAGAAGCVIEDQVLPKRCGHTANKKILPLPLYMRKLECALRARQTPLVVVARTDSMDLDDTRSSARTPSTRPAPTSR